ncbi:AimR family lysis-lysogeny pheromone receptor [Oceanobacillus halophilus]|uniref:Tetratricopeptide repeat protein n=1 Tax=Oceanobacillus halophilus TaxID=930130 RepID=A0A495A482_9BACI|nr:AimR family lysis-lysogeny pheromone receptor [Oceanobacillus halophilus]RKQ34356.1 hypothetical protein D8M06_08255 [Oceanobacillus halophilus]
MKLSAVELISDTNDLTFEQLIVALEMEHDEDRLLDKIKDFCLQSSSNDIQKKGMEFLLMNGYYEDLKKLIKINEQSPEWSNRQWAEVYKIFLALKRRDYEPNQLIDKMERIHTSEPELLCLLEFAKVNVQYNMEYYYNLGNSLKAYEELIKEIDDFFFLKSLKIRYNQVALVYTLMRNEIIVARRLAYKIFNETSNPSVRMDTHIKIGLSYTFESYIQAMFHMKEALSIAKKYNIKSAIYLIEQQNIPFLAAHFNKAEHISTTEKSEQAHLEIAKGNKQKAIELLENIPLNTPFRKYYLGKAKQDRTLLVQSYKDFVHKRSDYFFSRLPLNELRKLYV